MTIQQEGQSTVIGRACEFIASSPFTLSPTAITNASASGNVCDTGGTKRISAGRYTLTAGIVAPPSQTPETTTTQTVVVNDHITVTINGAALSR